MNATLHPSKARGHTDDGWLDSRHTFSFGAWRTPRAMGFGPLRVINEDRIDPERGFDSHPHRDMEILTYVIEGALRHADSTGHAGVIRPGEVQLMSAGTGVTHSEMNASHTDPVHLLQIWIFPARGKSPPRYQQADFGQDPGLRLVVSPDGRDDSLVIGNDVDIHRVLLTAGDAATLSLRHSHAWVQVVHGELHVNGSGLRAGDGMSLSDVSALSMTAHDDVNALVFDVPYGS